MHKRNHVTQPWSHPRLSLPPSTPLSSHHQILRDAYPIVLEQRAAAAAEKAAEAEAEAAAAAAAAAEEEELVMATAMSNGRHY